MSILLITLPASCYSIFSHLVILPSFLAVLTMSLSARKATFLNWQLYFFPPWRFDCVSGYPVLPRSHAALCQDPVLASSFLKNLTRSLPVFLLLCCLQPVCIHPSPSITLQLPAVFAQQAHSGLLCIPLTFSVYLQSLHSTKWLSNVVSFNFSPASVSLALLSYQYGTSLAALELS